MKSFLAGAGTASVFALAAAMFAMNRRPPPVAAPVVAVSAAASPAQATVVQAPPPPPPVLRLEDNRELQDLCNLNAETNAEYARLRSQESMDCGGSSQSPQEMGCFQSYERAIMEVTSRSAPTLKLYVSRAEKSVGRKLKDNDCCTALPSRYRRYGKQCRFYR